MVGILTCSQFKRPSPPDFLRTVAKVFAETLHRAYSYGYSSRLSRDSLFITFRDNAKKWTKCGTKVVSFLNMSYNIDYYFTASVNLQKHFPMTRKYNCSLTEPFSYDRKTHLFIDRSTFLWQENRIVHWQNHFPMTGKYICSLTEVFSYDRKIHLFIDRSTFLWQENTFVHWQNHFPMTWKYICSLTEPFSYDMNLPS